MLRPILSLVEPGAETCLGDVVIVFCARWCGTCRDFRLALERLTRDQPGLVFAWADIEDDAALVGDIEVENFPTLAIFSHGKPMYFGVTLPQAAVVEPLIRAMRAAGRPLSAIPDEVVALGVELRLS